jgi:hypothetical protein
MIKIYVDTEEEKQQLLKESEYIHDFVKTFKYKDKNGEIKQKVIGLDSDKAGILMHIYMNSDIIVVSKNWRYTNIFR